ncbi:MAG: hypothetical protein ABEJ89_04220 [Haloarculaceae archaeon]
MSWSRKKRDARMFLLGRRWWIPVAGALVTVVYNMAMILLGSQGVDFGSFGYLGGLLGGLAAGGLRGTNWMDGATDGLRAAAYGTVTTGVIAALGGFAIWYLTSGVPFVFTSFMYAMIGLIFFTPVFGFLGAIAGAVAVLVRRAVVPREYNPPTQ